MKSQNAIKMMVISGLTISGLSLSAQAGDLITATKGKAPGPEMKIKKSHVPQFELVKRKVVKGKTELIKVKAIPRLNVGVEDELKAGQISEVQLPAEKTFKVIKVNHLPSPKPIAISAYTGKNVKVAGVAKKFVDLNGKVHAPPPVPQFADVQLPEFANPKVDARKIEDMPPVQMKLLQALIFSEIKKNYNMALALFIELQNEASLKTEVTYQIALTSEALGLYSEYKNSMIQVLNDKDKEWQKKAALSLAQNAAEGDKELVAVLDPKINSLKLDLDKVDQYQMNRAKYYMDKNDLSKSFAAVDEIQMDSPLYDDALFLKSLILYKGNQIQEAIGLQQVVLKDVEEKRPNSEFKSIVALTLARLYFQSGQYKEAFNNYLKVDKANPEWLQAMVEQAWSQILSEDYEGAAGNMFSLHTDFFKKAFAPESYVARTVGYLNLCQYGDGAHVVYDFKKKYTPIAAELKDYGKRMKSNVNYYDTIKTWAKNTDLATVDGLPREFIFALTRHPSFILEQKQINSIEDQMDKINKISLDLVKNERSGLAAQTDARNQMASLKKKIQAETGAGDKKALQDQYAYQEKRLLSARIQTYIAQKARNSIKQYRTDGMARLDKEKTHFRELAGLAIKNRYNQMLTRLNETLDQNEVLQYELYSGAGDHLRYQMAGGDVNKKERPELKVADDKALNWKFQGEIWEDELGHYRSSLKNVCPPEDKVSSNGL